MRTLITAGAVVLGLALADPGAGTNVVSTSDSLVRGRAASGVSSHRPDKPGPRKLLTRFAGGSGSTVGPDRALYVTDGAEGRVLRVDPGTGAVATFASGLPKSLIGIGGAIDVGFIRRTAYVLVTLVGPDVGGSDVVSIYRVNSPTSSTVVADIGAFSLSHPPSTDFFIPTGLQYALETFRGGFLVTTDTTIGFCGWRETARSAS